MDEERPDDVGLSPASDYEQEPALIGASAEEADESRAAWQDELALPGDDADPHADEARELGFRLVWWEDESLVSAFDVMGKLFDNSLEQFDTLQSLYEAGMPRGLIREDWFLTQESSHLVQSGLQLLGLFVPELREEIHAVLKTIPYPHPSEEDAATITQAAEAVSEQVNERNRAAFERVFGGDKIVDDEPHYPGLN